MSATFSLSGHNIECIRDHRILFTQLNFQLEAGQALLLEGDNGCGKTSLLRIICGIRLPDAGAINWCDQSISHSVSEYYQHLLYIGHLDGVKRDLSVEENLKMGAALGRASGVSFSDALAKVRLAGYEDVKAQVLSAGQRRRVALALLLIRDCPLWILDEPFTALDVNSREVLESIMSAHLHNGGMIVLTSHQTIKLPESALQTINLSKFSQ